MHKSCSAEQSQAICQEVDDVVGAELTHFLDDFREEGKGHGSQEESEDIMWMEVECGVAAP